MDKINQLIISNIPDEIFNFIKNNSKNFTDENNYYFLTITLSYQELRNLDLKKFDKIESKYNSKKIKK